MHLWQEHLFIKILSKCAAEEVTFKWVVKIKADQFQLDCIDGRFYLRGAGKWFSGVYFFAMFHLIECIFHNFVSLSVSHKKKPESVWLCF